jgi:hypothetical protein
MNEPMEFTYGVSIDILVDPGDEVRNPTFKKFRLTGRFPSPAYADLQAVANAALDFLNGHFGTKFIAVEAYPIEELAEVAPGQYQLKEG